MRDNQLNPAFRADGWVLLLFLALVTFGWFSVCGASHTFDLQNLFSFDTRAGKQLIWICCSIGLGGMILMFDDRYFDMLADLFYWGMMALLLITPFIAHDIKGSRSWISLGPVSLQPAEFAKCATALMIAKVIGQHGFTLNRRNNFLRAAGIVFLPLALIVMQKETGSALVYFAFFLMFYREGMPGSILFCGAAAVTYFVVGIGQGETVLPGTLASVGESVVLALVWLFTAGLLRVYVPREPEHAGRILLWGTVLHLAAYGVSALLLPFDISWAQLVGCIAMFGYLGMQWIGRRVNTYFLIGLFAIGSIGFLYASDYVLNNAMKDTQTKLDYVPEQDTDFIFCTVGEEEGFVGAAGVLVLFLLLIWRLIALAERQTSTFGRVFGYSVLSILLFHLFINIGMVLGIAPVIGIPLPFFSYGGSSLWGFTLLLFIFLRIDAGRKR